MGHIGRLIGQILDFLFCYCVCLKKRWLEKLDPERDLKFSLIETFEFKKEMLSNVAMQK